MEPNLSSDSNLTNQSGANPLGANPSMSLPGSGLPDGASIAGEPCQPLQCDKAMGCIDGARDPSTTPLLMGELRGKLEDCTPCLQAFDLEVKLRTTMAPTLSELPPPDLASRITETLASIDLSQLDISDF